jgi:hypothetical protein
MQCNSLGSLLMRSCEDTRTYYYYYYYYYYYRNHHHYHCLLLHLFTNKLKVQLQIFLAY